MDLNNNSNTLEMLNCVSRQQNLQQTCNQLATDTISRQDAIDVLEERLQANGHSNVALVSELNRCIGYLMQLPSAQSELEDKIRAIGYTGKEGRIYIGGRLFAVRELAQ